ncbi:MAG: SOS response-associated peptidase [Stappiaceae bacterium]
MCGRFVLKAPPEEIKALFQYTDDPVFPARYNIAPTQPVGIVRQESRQRRFALARWGLVPSWVKDLQDFTLLTNARSETALAKPSFRDSMKHFRCLIPVSGFYEWKREDGHKTPYYIYPRQGGVIAFAGLWSRWMNAEGSELDSVAILTRAANGTVGEIHHRMPCVILPDDSNRWLDVQNVTAKEAAKILRPLQDDFFDKVPVSTRVNRVIHDDPELTEKVEPAHREFPKKKRVQHPDQIGGGGQLDLF